MQNETEKKMQELEDRIRYLEDEVFSICKPEVEVICKPMDWTAEEDLPEA